MKRLLTFILVSFRLIHVPVNAAERRIRGGIDKGMSVAEMGKCRSENGNRGRRRCECWSTLGLRLRFLSLRWPGRPFDSFDSLPRIERLRANGLGIADYPSG